MALGDIIFEFDVPIEARGNGLAIAFDGKYLYLMNRSETKIHKVTTTGVFVQLFETRINYGALVFDEKEGVFWAGGCTNTFEIDKMDLSGNVLATIKYNSFVPIDSNDPFPGFIDGITVDPITDTIFFSTDQGVTIYNITKGTQYIKKITKPQIGNLRARSNSGLTSDGLHLWLSLFGRLNGASRDIVQVDTEGNLLSRFSTGSGYTVEDLEFDSITFDPICVIWTNEATVTGKNRIRAWEIPGIKAPIPQANPQTCCQITIEHKTQLVPPARRGSLEINKEIFSTIEKVCPEKVIVRGFLRKMITYTAVLTTEAVIPNHTLVDDVPFQCIIDRNDANEGDLFDITGTTILCQVFSKEENLGGFDTETGELSLAYGLSEMDIIKLCVRKREEFFNTSKFKKSPDSYSFQKHFANSIKYSKGSLKPIRRKKRKSILKRVVRLDDNRI